MSILTIDLGKSKSVSCVYQTEAGATTGPVGAHRFETIQTTPAEVIELIEREKPERVVIEVGPAAGWVCDLCRSLGVEVLVANPNGEAWKWKKVKRKTDRDDALKLAKLTVLGQLPTVYMPAPAVRAWRELISYRHSLVRRQTQIKNTIRAMLLRHVIEWPDGAAGWSKESMENLAKLSQESNEVWRLMLREEIVQLTGLRASIAKMEAELNAISEKDDRATLLRTIPGVGPRLAETIAAVIDDPHRFKSPKQVGCYAGLTPRQYQSGNMDRQGGISGAGHELLRSLLVEVSWLGRRHNPWMDSVYKNAMRGSASRKKIAIVALARRLLVVCWAMLRDKTPWREGLSERLELAA